MVFSSLPIYLDPPNWPQQPANYQQGVISTDQNNPQLPPPPPPQPVGLGSSGSVKPGSMAERARKAKIPQPEAALKCPRCESTNTKFCYFNNYSLSQPRHFCKTCRRYWTRGGALRNVPVGGGCRRNKRSKGNRSKSDPSVENQNGNSLSSNITSTATLSSNSFSTDHIISQLAPSIPSPLPFLPPLHHLGTDYVSGPPGDNIGLNFGEIPAPGILSGGRSGVVGSILSSGIGDQQWRSFQAQVNQYPVIGNLETASNGLYRFEDDELHMSNFGGTKSLDSTRNGVDHDQIMSSTVKMEENQLLGLNLSRNFLGIQAGSDQNQQFWSGGNNAWSSTDLL